MAHEENAPLNITPGAIRFNTDSMKLEYFRIGMEGGATSSYAGIGTLAAGEWVQITTDTPDIQTGGTRGVIMGGYNPTTDAVEFITVSTTGNSTDTGNLSSARFTGAALASRTRALYFGGEQAPGTQINTIDLFTISSLADAIDFGDVSGGSLAHGSASVCNGTRGINMGGYRAPAKLNEISYVTVAQEGNTVDFGDLVVARDAPRGANSQTRGIAFGGNTPSQTTHIDFITMSTLGDAADFGDAGSNNGNGGGTSNSIRGIFCSGQGFGTDIEYVTIATLGNAVDFGDSIFDGYGNLGGMASPTRAAFAGGANPSATNLIEYVQIMSTGDAIDFGDLTVTRVYPTSVSNGHGGLG